VSVNLARAHLAQFGLADRIIVTQQSSATVDLAAAALGVAPERIAKTLSFRGAEPGTAILVVLAGDTRTPNDAFRQAFGIKPRMLAGDEVEALTGHAPGGVCPFGNPAAATVYLDESLRRFATVFPACGSANSAIELTLAELEQATGYRGWVSVGQIVNREGAS
jgi:prolyl-tRNA editing enzyme YbaK/EbsC (Cys-tRNA(Pro) deacylase)